MVGLPEAIPGTGGVVEDGAVNWSLVPLQESGGALSPGAAAIVAAGMFIGAGVLVLYTGAWDEIREAWTYLGMEEFDPAARLDDGTLLAVRGPVTGSDGSVTGALSGEECVAFVQENSVLEREVTEGTSSAGTGRSGDDGTRVVYSWSIRDATQESVPFEVETEHGAVGVEPGYAQLDLPARESEGTSLGGRILYRVPLVGQLVDQPRKTVERQLQHGDTVTVLGDIQPAADASDLVATVRGAGGRGEFTVTDKSGTSLAARSVLDAILSSLLALVCFLVAVVAIAAALAIGVLP